MSHHAGLGQRERQKSAHGIQRNQPVRDPAKQDQQHAAQHREHPDALRVHQTPSARGEAAGKITVLRDGAAESRKVRKGGVGGERQHQQDGAHRDVIEDALPGHRGDELESTLWYPASPGSVAPMW